MEGKSRYSQTSSRRSDFVNYNRLGSLRNEDVDLLTEHEVLGFEPGARLDPQAQRISHLFQPLKHRAAMYPLLSRLSLGIEFSVTTAVRADLLDERRTFEPGIAFNGKQKKIQKRTLS